MKIYFVRHGSTDNVENKIAQFDNDPLNQKGIDRSKLLAKHFASTKFDLTVSSTHTRAQQTAAFISPNFETSPLFVETSKPSELIGKSKEDVDFKKIINKIIDMYSTDPFWHYSDEENFEDLKKRGLQALEFLKSKNLENILVVSHGNFITLLAGLMIFGQDYPVDISLKFRNFMRITATGVCIFNFEYDKWKLQCWNDTSHLL